MSKEHMDCPACGGYWFDDLDESGRPYTCYVCCNTGYVSKEVYEEYGRQYEKEQILSAQSDAEQRRYGEHY